MADGVREPDEGVNAAGVRAGVATNRAQEAADESRKGERDPVAPDAPAALTSVSVREPDEATIREAFNLMECRDSWSGSWCSQRREAGLAALDRLVADRDTATERYAVVRHAYAIEAQARGAAEAEVAVLTARLTEAAEQKDKAFAAMTHWLGKANWAEAQVRELTEALTELHDWAKRCAGFHIAPETARARAALDAAEPGKEKGE